MTRAEQEKTGLKGGDKTQGDLRDARGDDHMPEGLERERKGPLDKALGRNDASGAVPRAHPGQDPARKKTGEF